jgi:hypothetical protein
MAASPHGIRNRIMTHILDEVKNAKAGKPASIWMKSVPDGVSETWPDVLPPQHAIAPVVFRPHVWNAPALTCSKVPVGTGLPSSSARRSAKAL